jgi:hypothetical protein
MRYQRISRVLALDLHPRRFGYVVVERPDSLLDWGVRSHRGGRLNAVLIRRTLRPLIKQWKPLVLIIHNPKTMSRPNRRRSGLLKLIQAEAKHHALHVCTVKETPDQSRGRTKHENAWLVAERFPVLRWKFPLKRRAWDSERYRMSMFSAASAIAAYAAKAQKQSNIPVR